MTEAPAPYPRTDAEGQVLAGALVELAETLVDEFDVVEFLTLLTDLDDIIETVARHGGAISFVPLSNAQGRIAAVLRTRERKSA